MKSSQVYTIRSGSLKTSTPSSRLILQVDEADLFSTQAKLYPTFAAAECAVMKLAREAADFDGADELHTWRLVSPAPGYDGPATRAVQCRSISLSRVRDAFVENNRLILWQLLAAGVGAYCARGGSREPVPRLRRPARRARLSGRNRGPDQLGRSAFSYVIARYPLTLGERRQLSNLKLVEEADHAQSP
jgi:hypothetical protein